jgi:hypothetical protein
LKRTNDFKSTAWKRKFLLTKNWLAASFDELELIKIIKFLVASQKLCARIRTWNKSSLVPLIRALIPDFSHPDIYSGDISSMKE